MANISETELQRRLKAVERKTSSTESNYVSNVDPVAGSFSEGDTHYNAATNNLWLFSNGQWSLDQSVLHTRYASLVSPNPPVIQSDVSDFSENPVSVQGALKDWRGLYWGNLTASTDPTDYEWFDTSTSPTGFTKYYTVADGIREQVGDPSRPGPGVSWILGNPTSAAMWVAEKFLVSGQESEWVVYPVQAADRLIPFITGTIAGSDKPALGSTAWITAVLSVAYSQTGRNYTNQKELGYGTVAILTYDNGKLAGKYVRQSGADTWVAPEKIIDGDLVVDGTIAASHIQATSIDATKLVITGTNAINYSTVGADVAGSAAAAIVTAATAAQTKADLAQVTAEAYADGIVTAEEARAIADATAKANAAQAAAETAAAIDAAAKVAVVTDNIYSTNTTTIDGGTITTGSLTANKLILNQNILEVEGNSLSLVSSALNSVFSFHVATPTQDYTEVMVIPFGATTFSVTGCGPGGGRSNDTAVWTQGSAEDRTVAGGGGGGAGCWDLMFNIPSGHTHVKVVVAASDVGNTASGIQPRIFLNASSVSSGASTTGPWTSHIALGGGEHGRSTYEYVYQGQTYQNYRGYGGNGGTVAFNSTYHVNGGYGGPFAWRGEGSPTILAMNMANSGRTMPDGGTAGIGDAGYNKTMRNDWPYGTGGLGSNGVDTFYINATVGYGSGAGGFYSNTPSSFTNDNEMSGSDGFIQLTYGG